MIRIDKAKFASEAGTVVESELWKALIAFLEKRRATALQHVLVDREHIDIIKYRSKYETLCDIEVRLKDPAKFLDDLEKEIADKALDNLKATRGLGGPKA
jgi:hypothetical protein